MRREIDLLRFPRVERELGTRTEAHRVVARRFGQEFFDGTRETGYGGYKYDGRWQAVALRLAHHYGLVERDARVLDIGCAKGFLVSDFRAIGVKATGIDVSAYAIEHSIASRYTFQADAMEVLSWAPPSKLLDLVVSINTLHNLTREQLARILPALSKMSREVYITVDAWHNDEERARMEAWNLTAKTMMHVAEWKRFFGEVGYRGDFGWFTP